MRKEYNIKTEYGDLGDSMTKLCHGRKQDSAGWKDIPVYDSSREKAVFIVVCRW